MMNLKHVGIFLVLVGLMAGYTGCSKPKNTKLALKQQANADKLLQDGKYEKAIETYQKAIDNNSDATGAYNNLGVAYLKTKKVDKAVGALKSAVQKNPQATGSHFNLATAYCLQGKREKALTEYKISKKQNVPNPNFLEDFFKKNCPAKS